MTIMETDRLRLSLYNPATDLLEHQAIYQSAAVRGPLGWTEPPDLGFMTRLFVDRAERWEAHTPGSGSFTLRWKDGGQMAGIVLLKALPYGDGHFSDRIEIGWHLAKHDWGKGIATEAAKRILEYGFGQLQLRTIWAVANTDNYPSHRVMERIGLRFIEETDYFYGERQVLYGLSREEYLGSDSDPV